MYIYSYIYTVCCAHSMHALCAAVYHPHKMPEFWVALLTSLRTYLISTTVVELTDCRTDPSGVRHRDRPT